MKQLFRLLTPLFLFIHLNSKAQTDIQQDWRVDSLLKQAGAKRPGLTMFGGKANRDKYVNMSVLNDSTRTLTWLTCYGQAFDAVKLTDDVFNEIKSYTLDPFDYYKDFSFNQLSFIRMAATALRQKGETALKDTGAIYYRVYTCAPVQQGRSTLQKEVAMEKMMSDRYLQFSLFYARTPQRLIPNDSFQLRLRLAGKMIQKGDTTIYYNTNPLSSAARIVLNKQVPGKMFVYDRQGQLADSVPLKAGKYAALLNEREDVFLLYRGWLELQSQQAIAGKEEVARLLNRGYTMPFKPAYWEENKQQLEQTLLDIRQRVDAVGNKVIGLIIPPPEEAEHLLAATYRDKPTEISYLPGLGFAYAAVYIRGHKRYELANHLGNVMAVVSDRKKAVDENGNGSVAYYNADVVNAVDYLPFGGQMPGRMYNDGDKYRYGFNGKENDNEVKGTGNQQDYGMRIYDPRIGRFLSIDPIASHYAMLTPYQFASNNPVQLIDLDGLEGALPFPWLWETLGRIVRAPNAVTIDVPPPPTLPLPPLVIPQSPTAPPAPISGLKAPEGISIDLSEPGVVRIPEANLDYIVRRGQPGDRVSATYRKGELDDPSYTGEFKVPKSAKDMKNQKSKDDVPDWARGYRPRAGEAGKDFAKRLLNKKYGEGKWKEGPGEEFNKIKKWGDQNFKTIVELGPAQYQRLLENAEEYNKELKEWRQDAAEIMKQNTEQAIENNKEVI